MESSLLLHAVRHVTQQRTKWVLYPPLPNTQLWIILCTWTNGCCLPLGFRLVWRQRNLFTRTLMSKRRKVLRERKKAEKRERQDQNTNIFLAAFEERDIIVKIFRYKLLLLLWHYFTVQTYRLVFQEKPRFAL